MKPTQDQIIAWAREVDIDPHDMCEDPRIAENNLERLVTLAYEAGRKDENEACAEVCEGAYLSERTALFAAGLIRARREQ